MGAELARRRLAVEMPIRLAGERGVRNKRQVEAFSNNDFRRADALQRGRQLVGGNLGDAEGTAGQIQPGQSGSFTGQGQCQQQNIALIVKQSRVGERAGRDDAGYRALNRPLAGCRIADLLADHHRFTELDQFRKIRLKRMIGNSGHLDWLSGRLPPRGQGDIEQSRGFLGIVEKQLVKIAHPIKKQRVRMLCLEAQILLHHRGVLSQVFEAAGRIHVNTCHSKT